jgi:Glycosyl hydrolases family 2, TIM barrel domain/Glycosyl hydrolases family 2, sugar binding domain/Glycosyl hydrolases family 2/Beta galactosidase small chain
MGERCKEPALLDVGVSEVTVAARSMLAGWVVLTILTALTPAHAQSTQRQYLSGTGSDDTVDWELKVSGGRKAGEWGRIPVPSNWEMQGFGTYRYGDDWSKDPAPDHTGEYRYRFKVPAAWRGLAVDIVFGAVMTDARVRINGREAGPVHQGGFYEFRHDVSRLLRYDAENLLEVTVSKFSAEPSVNRAERHADFWLFGGIFRPVWLEARPAQHIEHIALDARHTGELSAIVRLQGVNAPARLSAQVLTMEGSTVGETFLTEVKSRQTEVRLQSRLAGVKPWSAEWPHRYQLRLRLERGGRVLHEETETFGFRTVEVRAHDGLYINGIKARLKGVNRHSIWPASGRTTSRALSRQDIELIKGMNMNAVRMSHYPPDRHFLELTDELGLFVIDELTGWQAAYDTAVGAPRVRELVERDVNHPSIILWANGNEGGWNTDLDDDFAQYDPQRRTVIHPWANFNGIDASHYESLSCCAGKFFGGDDLILPTEFLHALYDGGGGAGLEDWWNKMLATPLAVGGFIWAFADEGIVREDRGGAIDVAGNLAPDGVVGPYREKEGSYDAIREIWSPVYIPLAELDRLPGQFDGKLRVENRYDFTSLSDVRFTWRLADFSQTRASSTGATEGSGISPPVAPGLTGVLDLQLPANWRSHDALYVEAIDPHGRKIYTWSWMLRTPAEVASSVISHAQRPASRARATQAAILLEANGSNAEIDRSTGRLIRLTRDGAEAVMRNGPRWVLGESALKRITDRMDGKDAVVEAEYDGELRYVRWRMRPSGWLQLDYGYSPQRGSSAPWLGVTFDAAQDEVKGLRWLGKGPYRVWKNRRKGVEFGVWEKPFNDAITGVRWTYPEFKGFHDDWYWAQIETSSGAPLLLVSATQDLTLRLFTPAQPEGADFDPRSTRVEFPPGDISFLHGIAPIGTKFDDATAHGPQGQPNVVPRRGNPYEATIFLRLGAD